MNWQTKSALENKQRILDRGKKVCYCCKEEKLLEEYYPTTSNKTGYYSYCKPCLSEKQKNRVNKNREKYTAIRMLQEIRGRCRKIQMEFDLDVQWLEDKLKEWKCEVTGLEFVVIGDGISNPFSPSVDRIDPTKGYLKENCRVVLLGYNMMKGRGTDEDCYKIAKAVYMAEGFGIVYS